MLSIAILGLFSSIYFKCLNKILQNKPRAYFNSSIVTKCTLINLVIVYNNIISCYDSN